MERMRTANAMAVRDFDEVELRNVLHQIFFFLTDKVSNLLSLVFEKHLGSFTLTHTAYYLTSVGMQGPQI